MFAKTVVENITLSKRRTMDEIKAIKKDLEEIKELLKAIHTQLVPSQTVSSAKVYQIKEKARKKALAIKQKLDLE